MTRIRNTAFAAVALVSCLGAATADTSQSAETVVRTYAGMTLMTATPVRLSASLSMLCRQLTLAEQKAMASDRTDHGPHAQIYARVFMNAAAATTFGATTAPFPVGSVIVKEKRDFAGVETALAGLGGMIKRPAGYDSEHGDWEYFYVEPGAKLDSGKLEPCRSCHSSGSARDHVYGDWSRG